MLRSGHDVLAATRLGRATIRTGLGAAEIAQALVDDLQRLQGKLPQLATRHDRYTALACTVRDRLLMRALTTAEAIADRDSETKLVAYLSAEFLTGPARASILNSARVGSFSSDRAVRQYSNDIWNVRSLSDTRAASTAPVSGGDHRE